MPSALVYIISKSKIHMKCKGKGFTKHYISMIILKSSAI